MTHAHAPLKILFVEDSESDYELMTYRLKAGGLEFEAHRVDNEKDLTSAMGALPWSLVISDHRLPGFGSEQALACVRQHSEDIPFLIVSGTIGEDVAVEAMRAGADDYLMKDKLKRLVPAIERSLRAASERRERKAAERARRETETRLSATAANLPGILFQMTTDLEGMHPRVQLVSEGSLHLFGLPARVFADDDQAFVKQFHAGDAALLKETLVDSVQAQRDLVCELRLVQRGNAPQRWVYLHARSRAMPDASRQWLWDGALLDISAQKQAEEDLRASQEELRRVTAEFEKRREEERGAIAREIHDDIGGTLTKLKADIAWLRKQFGERADAEDRFVDMLELIEHTVAASQRIAKDLRPGILDYGLIPALEWQMKDFEKRTGLRGVFATNADDIRLDPNQSTALFRVLQEALTNIVKHAQAKQVTVELFDGEEDVTLEIRDDGVGIANVDRLKQNSFGLRGMTERIKNLGGWLDLSGAPGKGTTLMLSIPKMKETGND